MSDLYIARYSELAKDVEILRNKLGRSISPKAYSITAA